MDKLSREERSRMMGRVKSKNTSIELVVKRSLWGSGFRYARSAWGLPGSPDIVLPALRTAVFVHGCFWHGHHCYRGRVPATNENFWNRKLEANKERDRRVQLLLRKEGWAYFVVWQCSIAADVRKLILFLKRRRMELANIR
jgi:DNA mismatch endonuclease, patch repair protein